MVNIYHECRLILTDNTFDAKGVQYYKYSHPTQYLYNLIFFTEKVIINGKQNKKI